MKDFRSKPNGYVEVTVRNEWRRGVLSENGAKPDHVLLDVGVRRGGFAPEWNSISLTPARARRVAEALLMAADEADP